MLSMTVDVIKKIGQIKEKLLGCLTEAAVEDVFRESDIVDFRVKTMLLRQSMQVLEAYDVPINQASTSCSDTSLSDEDVYKEELDFFLDGKWKELV